MAHTHFAVRNAASTLALALAATALTTGLTACGGGDDTPAPAATVTITGVAATGAPIKGGKVNAVNAAGKTATATSAADGSYSISVAAGAPYALNITDTAGKVWYSYAPDAGVANITPCPHWRCPKPTPTSRWRRCMTLGAQPLWRLTPC